MSAKFIAYFYFLIFQQMWSMNHSIFLLLLCLSVIGCQPASQKPRDFHTKTESSSTTPVVQQDNNASDEDSRFVPFYVYQDGDAKNRFIPSGYMPNGNCIKVNPLHQDQCVSGSCLEVVFDLACARQDQRWGGVYWLNPADNWGQHKGGYNLDGAQRLVFQARGAEGQERIEEFKMGGIGLTADYPDSDYANIGPVILTTDWREYVIDLRGKNLSYIAGGFAWAASAVGNDRDQITFYLDEIRYE